MYMRHYQKDDRVFYLDGQYLGKFGIVTSGFDEMQKPTFSDEQKNELVVWVDNSGYVFTKPENLVLVTEENKLVLQHTRFKLKMNWDNWDQPVEVWKEKQQSIMDELKVELGVS